VLPEEHGVLDSYDVMLVVQVVVSQVLQNLQLHLGLMLELLFVPDNF